MRPRSWCTTAAGSSAWTGDGDGDPDAPRGADRAGGRGIRRAPLLEGRRRHARGQRRGMCIGWMRMQSCGVGARWHGADEGRASADVEALNAVRAWRALGRARCSDERQDDDARGDRRADGEPRAAHLEQGAVAGADDAHGCAFAEPQSAQPAGFDITAPDLEHRRARACDAGRQRTGNGSGDRSRVSWRRPGSGHGFEHAVPRRVENDSQEVLKDYSFRALRSTASAWPGPLSDGRSL